MIRSHGAFSAPTYSGAGKDKAAWIKKEGGKSVVVSGQRCSVLLAFRAIRLSKTDHRNKKTRPWG
ncbi:MAG: hypothetical protein ACOY4D_03130 [Pseudomonadota bacterium]